MVLTALQFIEGILKVANFLLILVASGIAISMFTAAGKKKYLKPWRILITVLVLFTLQTILGALRAFGVWDPGFITRIIPTAMLGLIVWALVLNINMKS